MSDKGLGLDVQGSSQGMDSSERQRQMHQLRGPAEEGTYPAGRGRGRQEWAA